MIVLPSGNSDWRTAYHELKPVATLLRNRSTSYQSSKKARQSYKEPLTFNQVLHFYPAEPCICQRCTFNAPFTTGAGSKKSFATSSFSKSSVARYASGYPP